MLDATEAVILAGGAGTRLAPALPPGWPKVLAPVGGVPFLGLLLDHLHRGGLRRITLCLGHGAAHVEAFLARQRVPTDVSIQAIVEPRPLGTAGALRDALARVRSDPFLVLNGDTYCDADLQDLLASHERRRAEVTIALAETDDTGRFGRIELGADERVLQFREKAQPGRGLASAGIYAINAGVIRDLPPGTALSLEYDVLPRYAGRALYGRTCCRWFIDIGTPEALLRAAGMIAPRIEAAR